MQYILIEILLCTVSAPEGWCVYVRQRTLACVITHIYHFDTLDQRKRRADGSRIARLSVRYKICRTLILINTFHSIIKFL